MQSCKIELAKFLAECSLSSAQNSAADEKQNNNDGANYCYEAQLPELLVQSLSHLVINFCQLFEIVFVRLITRCILPVLMHCAFYIDLSHTAELKSRHTVL